MIPRPLTLLFLLAVLSSGCFSAGVRRRAECHRSLDPSTAEALGLKPPLAMAGSTNRGVAGAGATSGSEAPGNASSTSTGASSAPLRPAPATRPARRAAIEPGPFLIKPVTWSVFEEDIPPPECDESCAAEPEWALCRNLRNFGPTLWGDAKGVAQFENAAVLGVSLAAAIGIRQDLDGQVRADTYDRPLQWGDATRVLGYMGEAQYQIPVLLALSGYAAHGHNRALYDFSEALLSAYTINGLATLAIKGIADTDRPDADWNNGHWGFPSFHAASAFTIAAVIDGYHGWPAALPAYTLAGLIAWSRIDQRDHDLSDVVFGAAMGWVIGKSVASRHLDGDGRVIVFPWMHPSERALGMAVEARF